MLCGVACWLRQEGGRDSYGAAVFAYVPKFFSDEELEAYWIRGELRVGGEPESICFSPEGELYAASADNVYHVDVETGEMVSLFATAGQAGKGRQVHRLYIWPAVPDCTVTYGAAR